MTDDRFRPLETRYAGCRFRSRLEARWARFFDYLDIPWEYEPEGLATSAGNYLPDFRVRIPQYKQYDSYQWFEVKPPHASEDPRHKALASDAPVIVARGMPRSYSNQHKGWDSPLQMYGIGCGATPVAFCDASRASRRSTPPATYCTLGDNRHWCQEDMNNTLGTVHLALYGWHPPVVAEHDALDDTEFWGEGRWSEEDLHGYMTYPPLYGTDIDAAYEAARFERFGQ